MATWQREVREDPLDNPAQYQHPAQPDSDRHDHQMQLQGDGTAVVHRSAYALEAAVVTLVPLDPRDHGQDQEVNPEQAPERLTRRELRSLVADLAVDGAPACDVQRDSRDEKSRACTQQS